MIYMFVDTLKKLMKEKGLRACDLVDDDVTAQYISKLVLMGKLKILLGVRHVRLLPTWE